MKDIVIQPTFYDKFECIGSGCKNDCCHDWNIDFSKEEFKNIKRKMKSDEFTGRFQDAFIVPKGEQKSYKIKLDENRRCKFLDECGLCRIYKEVGYENMSLTCKVFPRMVTHYAGNYYRFLSISCEEVIRLLLEEKEGILIEVEEKELLKEEKSVAMNVNIPNNAKLNDISVWNDAMMLLLGVLQNRDYTFSERMVVLGFAMKELYEMQKNNQFDSMSKYIQQFIEDFNDINSKEIYSKLFKDVNKNDTVRALQTLNYFILEDSKNLYNIKDKIKDRIDFEKYENLEIEPEQTVGKLKTTVKYNTEKYQQAIKEFEEFMKGKEWWIENIMIEGFLSVRMPFWINGGMWKNYCVMSVLYSIMLFVWTCCIEKNSTKEDFVYCTSLIARKLFHDKKTLNELEEILKKTESETLAYMAILVL